MSSCALLPENVLIRCVWTDLNILGPCDLTKLTYMDPAEKSGIQQRRENASPYIRRQIDDAFDTVGISDSDTELCQRLYSNWSNHGNKVASS